MSQIPSLNPILTLSQIPTTQRHLMSSSHGYLSTLSKIHAILHFPNIIQNTLRIQTLCKHLNVVTTVSGVDYFCVFFLELSIFYYFTFFTAAIVSKRKLWWCTLSTISRQVFLLPFTTTATELLWVEKDKLSQ